MSEQPTPQPQNQAKPAAAQPQQTAASGLRKRQQIKNTNRNIFFWMTGAAIIVSICLVALQFLVRELIFNQQVINQKSATNKTLIQNKQQAELLRENINKLLADGNLNSLKYEAANTETTALNVILDALPVEGDVTAFANSLQAVVLPRSGVGIRELSTMAVDSGLSADIPVETNSAEALSIPFSAGFAGNYESVTKALIDMSNVIRPIDLKQMTIRAEDGGTLQVMIDGTTYYMPARSVEVTTEVVKP